MTNPASLLSAARDPSIIDSALGALSTFGGAIVAQPVLVGAGLLAIAAIMRAAWVLTREPIRTAAATVAAYEATKNLPRVIYWHGVPRPVVHSMPADRLSAYFEREKDSAWIDGHDAELAVRAVARTAGAFSLFPLPEPDGGEPTRPSTFRA